MNKLPAFLNPGSNRRGSPEDSTESYRPLLACWLIELVLLFGWHKGARGIRSHKFIFGDDHFLEVAGMNVELDTSEGEFLVVSGKKIQYTEAECVKLLKDRLDGLHKEWIEDSLSLFANIELVGEVIGLSQAAKAILSYAAVMEIFPAFRSVISSRSETIQIQRLAQVIAHLTGHNESEIRSELSRNAPLAASGIISIADRACDLEDKISLLDGFGSLLIQSHESADTLIENLLKRAGQSNLVPGDYPHLAGDILALKSYLGNALIHGERGVNILLYGIPGTGKTEFVKAISTELGAELYEIAYSDEDGNPRKGRSRLRAYSLCQRILTKKDNTLLMFDEIEDVFPSHGGMLVFLDSSEDDGGMGSCKAWINRTLETNATPAIWITNDADIDPAYLRRFDYSVRFSVPPRQVRMSIARRYLGQFNPAEEWLSKIASCEQMTPAQYERAAKVARLSSGGDDIMARRLVEQALDRSATLLGQNRTPARNIMHTSYDPRFVNTDMDIGKIVSGLKIRRRGTFCFYGPSGTGKSEFARHISDEIGMPILVRRASDILSMWVGEAEKNIAKMFADARQQEAVLVLDEADSFLADRRDAAHSWEVTQVNELLTQMESFDGIFICTTNLIDKLDQASLRRFAFKVRFDYLTPDQGWAMYLKEFSRLGGDPESAAVWEKSVRGLRNLTPGDFSVAARQFGLIEEPVTPGELFRQLREECAIKRGTPKRIGFFLDS
ncbi:MAG: AAA family ATPase [Burkholderiales bacterium]|nr:AAA family ATPase [Burkholderiales bacterium]